MTLFVFRSWLVTRYVYILRRKGHWPGLIGLAAILLLASACATPAVPATPAPSPSPTRTFTPTPSPTPAPSATPSLTATDTPPPTHTPTATVHPTATPLACWTEPGRLEEGVIRSDKLRLPMEYKVYLPPCYDQQPNRRYPVLYMIHGQNYNNDQWERLGAATLRDELIAQGELPPFILVLPRDRSWAQPQEDMFGEVMIEQVVPFVDQTYRTLDDRHYRSVGGLSRGASWSLHLGLSQWRLFGALGAHSLPVFWGDTPFIRTWLAEIPPESMPRIYMDIGEQRPARDHALGRVVRRTADRERHPARVALEPRLPRRGLLAGAPGRVFALVCRRLGGAGTSPPRCRMVSAN